MSKPVCDTHVHTKFSHDSIVSPVTYIEKAINLGLQYIAFTDHLDIGSCYEKGSSVIDYDKYFASLGALKEKYKNKIYIAIGVEAGFIPSIAQQTADIISKYPFDYILNSIHETVGLDCYFPSYFEGRSKKESYRDYLSHVRMSLDAPYDYTAVAHMTYITRGSTYPDFTLLYSEFNDILDDILLTIIAKNKVIELNTSTARRSLCIPDFDVMRRYYQLGGRLVTLASDSHTVSTLTRNFDLVAENLKKIGFDSLTISKNRVLSQIKI